MAACCEVSAVFIAFFNVFTASFPPIVAMVRAASLQKVASCNKGLIAAMERGSPRLANCFSSNFFAAVF